MDRRRVLFGSLVVLAASLNLSFFVGDLSDPALHDSRVLFGALVVSLLATALEFGERSQAGAVQFAANVVVDLQLLAAACVWAYAGRSFEDGFLGQVSDEVLSLSGGALLGNVVSVVLLVVRIVSGGMLTR